MDVTSGSLDVLGESLDVMVESLAGLYETLAGLGGALKISLGTSWKLAPARGKLALTGI